eukprot:3102887-Rhodomonas_salina.1
MSADQPLLVDRTRPGQMMERWACRARCCSGLVFSWSVTLSALWTELSMRVVQHSITVCPFQQSPVQAETSAGQAPAVITPYAEDCIHCCSGMEPVMTMTK